MIVFGIGEDTGLKEITLDQAAIWDFGNFFVPFWIPKMIVVYADDLFYGMFRNTFQESLPIPEHAVERVKQKEIINEGFHRYLKKVQKINSAEEGSLHQQLQGVLFSIYSWYALPVDRTDIDLPVVDIGREFTSPMHL